jgi:hypothetical protein
VPCSGVAPCQCSPWGGIHIVSPARITTLGLLPPDAAIKKPGVAAGPDVDEVLRAVLG